MDSRLVLSETDHHAGPAVAKRQGGNCSPQILHEIEAKPVSSNGLLYYLPPPLIFKPSAISAVIRITFLVGKKVHSTTVCQNAFIFRLLSHFFMPSEFFLNWC